MLGHFTMSRSVRMYTVFKENNLNKHSESIAKAIQVPNRSHQIQTCNQYQYTSLQIERIILKLVELTMWTWLRGFSVKMVAVHFLSDHCRCCVEIWYTAVALKNLAQVRIWVLSSTFWRSYAPWTWKISV